MDYSYFDVIKSRRQPSMANHMMSNMETSGRFPSATPLAMAYVPFQTWEEPFDASDALQAGTLFPQLDLPFMEEGYAR